MFNLAIGYRKFLLGYILAAIFNSSYGASPAILKVFSGDFSDSVVSDVLSDSVVSVNISNINADSAAALGYKIVVTNPISIAGRTSSQQSKKLLINVLDKVCSPISHISPGYWSCKLINIEGMPRWKRTALSNLIHSLQ